MHNLSSRTRSVQLLMAFAFAAGLCLGVPTAEAQPLPTDTPGINSFYPPYLFIIFDTSQSMGYFPGDPNGYPGYLLQDWDPTTMTVIPNDPTCQSKFCLGKRALYVALPQYSSRINMGLGTYNQYYETAANPANFETTCTYDEIAYNDGSYGNAKTLFTADPSVIGDPAPNSTTVPGAPFTCTPGNSATSHTCERWANGTANAYSITTNQLGSPAYTTGSTLTPSSGLVYTYWKKSSVTVTVPLSTSGFGASCPVSVTGYTGGLFGCTAANPCDLNGGTTTQVVTGVVRTYGSSQGASVSFGGHTYNENGGQPASPTFTTSCGLASPYTGTGASCNGVIGGCTLTSAAPVTVDNAGSATVYYNNNTPGAGWVVASTSAQQFQYELTGLGEVCPPINTVISQTTGPAAWQYLATEKQSQDANWQTDPGCDTSLQHSCVWTMMSVNTVNLENPRTYCVFQRTNTTWETTTTTCTYTAKQWSYTYLPAPVPTCNLKQWTVYFGRPSYQYSYLLNNGDLVGATTYIWNGNNDAVPTPTAVTYSNGSFSNGDCPNLITNGGAAYPACNNGIECKLSWTSNLTIGGVSYPHGRWSQAGAGPFPYANPATIYPASDPPATLTSALWPPNPMLYGSNWLYGSGHGLQYSATLNASLYNPLLANPPPSQTNCATCSFTYSYLPPPYLQTQDVTSLITNNGLVWTNATSLAGNPTTNANLPPMPAVRTDGWSRESNGTPAVTWTAIAPNNATLGASPATNGPLLQMLSKYNAVTNPAGLRRPAYGDYTPLTGTMQSVDAYMRTVINTDPYAGCRGYYVLLLTDGEEQPANLGLNPVAPVQDMRSPAFGGTMMTSGGVPVDVKTFVVGFGLSSNQLNQMAQAGGTSVGPDGVTYSPTGTAFQAGDYTLLLDSLSAAFGNILSGYFTRSQPVANSVGDEVYIGYLKLLSNGREWQGYLDAVNPSVPGGTGTYPNTGSQLYWQYSTSINTQPSRTIYTMLGNPAAAGPLAFFDYPGSGWNVNTGANQTLLEDTMDPTAPATALQTIEFLLNVGVPQGVFQYFSDNVTPKLSRASDIYHSVPAIVDTASQSQNWPMASESIAYKAFTTNNAARSRNIFIGANDGMLHAITDAKNADGGVERWAYVPPALLPALPNMLQGHVFGVDGSMGVADVCFGAGCNDPSGNGWNTLLVGSLRQGGNALFALDVTNPTAPKHLWQDSSSTQFAMPRLGMTYSAPVIGRTSPNTLGPTWSVFVGGGVAPHSTDDFNSMDPWGNALYVLKAQDGTVLYDGATYARFWVPDDPLDPAKNNIAARPTLFRPSDGSMVDRVFFNDTEGKIWRAQVTSPSIANWWPSSPTPFFDPASVTAACELNSTGIVTPILNAATGLPVSAAIAASPTTAALPMTLPLSIPRPIIFNRPSIGLDASGNVVIYVGTGDSDNPNSTPTQDYFYAVTDLDNGTCAQPLFVLAFSPSEKVLSTPAFIGNNVILTTYVPPGTGPSACNDAGKGFIYSFDAFTGQPTATLLNPITNTYVSNMVLQVRDQNGNLQSNLGIPTSPIVVNQNGTQSIIVGNETTGGNVSSLKTNVPPIPFKMQGWQRIR